MVPRVLLRPSVKARGWVGLTLGAPSPQANNGGFRGPWVPSNREVGEGYRWMRWAGLGKEGAWFPQTNSGGSESPQSYSSQQQGTGVAPSPQANQGWGGGTQDDSRSLGSLGPRAVNSGVGATVEPWGASVPSGQRRVIADPGFPQADSEGPRSNLGPWVP